MSSEDAMPLWCLSDRHQRRHGSPAGRRRAALHRGRDLPL